MNAEQITDTMDCGPPQEVWQCMIDALKARSRASEEIALSLQRDAKDAQEQADEHHEAAQMFHSLALAVERAPVTFPAQGTEAQRATTENTGVVHDGPVPEGNAP